MKKIVAAEGFPCIDVPGKPLDPPLPRAIPTRHLTPEIFKKLTENLKNPRASIEFKRGSHSLTIISDGKADYATIKHLPS